MLIDFMPLERLLARGEMLLINEHTITNRVQTESQGTVCVWRVAYGPPNRRFGAEWTYRMHTVQAGCSMGLLAWAGRRGGARWTCAEGAAAKGVAAARDTPHLPSHDL